MTSEERRVEAQRAEDDSAAVLSTPAGRRWVWRLLSERCALHASSYTGESISTAYSEGRRAVAVELMRELQASPRTRLWYLEMVREAVEAEVSARPDAGESPAE